jgi:hypothetical protein
MPPKNIKSNCMLYWLLFIPITYEVVKKMFDPTITLGDIIVLIITIPAFGILVWQGINYWVYRRTPFVMDYQEKHPYDIRELSKSRTIPIGNSTIILRVTTKKELIISRAHLRFIESKNPKSKGPPREIVSIDYLQYEAEGLRNTYFSEQDHINGRQTRFDDPYRCTPEDYLYIHITVKSTRSWSGYIMFQSIKADGHRGYAFLPLKIEGKEAQNERNNKPKP